jgi:lysophospholipase L1-like esterase
VIFWSLLILWGAVSSICFAIALFVVVNGAVRRTFVLAVLEKMRWTVSLDYIIVGDSLAQQCNWAGEFSRRRRAAFNLATGGATIKDIASQIMRARAIRSKYLLINGGLNDLLFDDAPIEQIEYDFKALLRRIDDRAQAIVTLLPYVSDSTFADRIDKANLVIRRLCEERGCAVIDLNPEISAQRARCPEMTNDGLHFTQRADSIWIEAVRRQIASMS